MSDFSAGMLAGLLGWAGVAVLLAVGASVSAVRLRRRAGVGAGDDGLTDLVDLTAEVTNPDVVTSPGSIARAIAREDAAQALHRRFSGTPWLQLDERTRDHFRFWSRNRPLWLDADDPCVCLSWGCYGPLCDACAGLSVDMDCPADPGVRA